MGLLKEAPPRQNTSLEVYTDVCATSNKRDIVVFTGVLHWTEDNINEKRFKSTDSPLKTHPICTSSVTVTILFPSSYPKPEFSLNF